MINAKRSMYLLVAIMLMLLCMSRESLAQTVVSNIPLSHTPSDVAVNATTNLVYVPNSDGPTLSVIDGATNTVKTVVSLGFQPQAVAVNPATNRIYVGGFVHGVAVLDGVTNAIIGHISFDVGTEDIEVNPITNQIYVGNSANRNISVVDGNPNSASDNTVVAVISTPYYLGGDIAANPATNRIYVASSGFDFTTNSFIPITVIDGATNTVSATITLDDITASVAVNPITNRIYAVNRSTSSVWVIDGSNNSLVATIGLNNTLAKIAVNPTTNRIHVTDGFGSSLWIIDGGTDTFLTRLTLGYQPVPTSVAVNQATSYVYVGNIGFNSDFGGQSVSVIDDPPVPRTQINALIEKVRNYNLSQGIGNSLDAKLENARAALDSANHGDVTTACNKLSAFINEVQAQADKQQISTAQSTDLIDAANRIKRTLGCQ